jgi:hypothetical protein
MEKHNKGKWRFHTNASLQKALEGSDFVFVSSFPAILMTWLWMCKRLSRRHYPRCPRHPSIPGNRLRSQAIRS